jgi:hypothetical protein
MAMHACERVGLDFVESAPVRFVSTVDLAITRPFRVGTTRAVDTRSEGRTVEEVIAWHPQHHMTRGTPG